MPLGRPLKADRLACSAARGSIDAWRLEAPRGYIEQRRNGKTKRNCSVRRITSTKVLTGRSRFYGGSGMPDRSGTFVGAIGRDSLNRFGTAASKLMKIG